MVYENINYSRQKFYKVLGEVVRPGIYPLNKKELTLREAINLSGGITEQGSLNSISISNEFEVISEDGIKFTNRDIINNIDLNFELSDGNIITVLSKANVFKIEGNVYNPGLIALSDKVSLRKAIELGGGYKPNSLKNKVYIIRSNGEIENVTFIGRRIKKIFPGDRVIVPVDPSPQEFDLSSLLADFSSTLANLVAILIIIDRNQ